MGCHDDIGIYSAWTDRSCVTSGKDGTWGDSVMRLGSHNDQEVQPVPNDLCANTRGWLMETLSARNPRK